MYELLLSLETTLILLICVLCTRIMFRMNFSSKEQEFNAMPTRGNEDNFIESADSFLVNKD